MKRPLVAAEYGINKIASDEFVAEALASMRRAAAQGYEPTLYVAAYVSAMLLAESAEEADSPDLMHRLDGLTEKDILAFAAENKALIQAAVGRVVVAAIEQTAAIHEMLSAPETGTA